MKRDNTVYVIGAGASKEVGFPTGDELKTEIAADANIRYGHFNQLEAGDHEIAEAIRLRARELDPSRRKGMLTKAWFIAENMPLAPSIDNFLDSHKNDPEVVATGKILIAASILRAERNSKLFRGDPWNTKFSAVTEGTSNYWLQRLFTRLVAERDFESFLEALAAVTFVSFNYDRCIQLFMIESATQYFNLDVDEQGRVNEMLEVIYPYGSLGNLFERELMRDRFGIDVRANNLLLAAENIRTFTEGAENQTIEVIQNRIRNADNVSFLGFGFLPLNLNLLFDGRPEKHRTCLATTYGLSEDSRTVLKSRLTILNSPKGHERLATILLINKKCFQFFEEFQMRLEES